MSRVLDPSSQYSQDGMPVVTGAAYFGVANTDPTVLANQIPIFSDRDLLVPFAGGQPVATDAQGRLTAAVYIGVEEYSYQVFDSLGTLLRDEALLEPLNTLGLITNNIDMDGFKHINVADANANDQYGTFGQNTKLFGQAIATDADSLPDALVVNFPVPPSLLEDGQQIKAILQHGANTGACTLKLNAFAPKNIVVGSNKTPPPASTGGLDYVASFTYSAGIDSFILENPASILQRNTYIYTANDTYTPQSGTALIEYEAIGAGGGAGGVDGQGATTAVASEAGGGGGYCWGTTTTIDGSYTIVIGTGGSGGAAGSNNGTSGTATTISSLSLSVSAGGGAGGNGSTGSIGNPSRSATRGANGGTATGGDININGNASSAAEWTGAVAVQRSSSGASIYGGSVASTWDATGSDGGGIGAGGGAVASEDVTGNRAGGDGIDGYVKIIEYIRA